MNQIRDGDLYKTITLFGKTFEIKYGFYEDYERENAFCEPIPIYPNFKKEPIYTDEGFPFVTQMQVLCKYGDSRFSDGCCVDCAHFLQGQDLIGICKCPENIIKRKKTRKRK